ncbi:MAG: hypothetical protein QM654_09885 [Dysgonamonadaceae bacterium]
MKRLNYTIKLSCILWLVFWQTACTGIFVEDPIDPRLPKYTEEGNNTAGALIDGKVWRSIVQTFFGGIIDRPDIVSYPEQDSLQITYCGEMDGQDFQIQFHLKGYHIQKIEDLKQLDGKILELDGVLNAGSLFPRDAVSSSSNGGKGQLYFRNIQVQDSSSAVISGTFGFESTNQNGVVTHIRNGRFDYTIFATSNFRTEDS